MRIYDLCLVRYNSQWKIKASLKLWEQCTQVTEADENPSPTAPAALRQWPQRPIWSECSLPGCYTVITRRAWVRVCCFGHTNTQLDNNRSSATECNHTLVLQHIVNIMHLCLLPSPPLNLRLCNGQGVYKPCWWQLWLPLQDQFQ